MKSLIVTVLCFILSSSLYAGNTAKQSELAIDMRIMLSAMADIQRAGFYDSKDGMVDGIHKLKKALHSLTTTDAKNYLPKDKAYADKFVQKRARMISMYADDLLESLQNNKMEDAQDDYALIMKQCSSCHSRIRK